MTYMTPDERLAISDELKDSLIEHLREYSNLRLNSEYQGDSILWNYGGYNGRIPIIGKTSDDTLLIEFPQTFSCNGACNHSISDMESVISFHNGIESFFELHGKKTEHPHRSPTYSIRISELVK